MVSDMVILRDKNEKLESALREHAQDFNMSLQIDKQKDAEIERLRTALRRAAKDLESCGGYVKAAIAYAEAEENTNE